MSYGRYLVGQPLFWALLAGGFAGAAIAALTSRPERARDPRRSASRRSAAAMLALTGVVATLALSVLVPDEPAPFAPATLATALVGFVAVGLGARFFRAAGLPILLVAGTIAVVGSWILAPYVPVRSPTELARFTVISMRPDELTVEVTALAARASFPSVERVPSGRLVAAVEIVEPVPALFLLGGRRFARHVGFVEAGAEDAEPVLPEAEPSDAAAPRRLGSRSLFRAAERIGALNVSLVAAERTRINVLRSFILVIPPDGEPRLEPE